MSHIVSTITHGLLLAIIVQFASPGIVRGHGSGAGATPEHILLEVGVWGLAVAVALGLIVLVFWMRAKRRGE